MHEEEEPAVVPSQGRFRSQRLRYEQSLSYLKAYGRALNND